MDTETTSKQNQPSFSPKSALGNEKGKGPRICDTEWMERTGLDHDSLCAAVESLVFISERPIKLQKLRDHLDKEKKMPLKVVHEAIERLKGDYERSHHGIRLVEIGEGFQFRTKAAYASFIQGLAKPQTLSLGPTALEVLAIVAYKQPISRAAIDKIRGVDSSHILRTLMDRRLLKVRGRSEKAGRPVVYGTTGEFLEMFNLASLEDLPPEHELKNLVDNQDLGDISDIKEFVSSSVEDRKKFHFDELGELDELAKTIREVSSHTSFTRSIVDEEKKDTKGEKGPRGEEKKSAFDILEDFVAETQRPPSGDEELGRALDKALESLGHERTGERDGLDTDGNPR
ncbi:MAG: SMC-Scp complex subunit ScpB [Bacteriovoracales bacterium]|nr:SMC-Scp complex subunit ScpB [Bacteriovoracales bacterium]